MDARRINLDIELGLNGIANLPREKAPSRHEPPAWRD